MKTAVFLTILFFAGSFPLAVMAAEMPPAVVNVAITQSAVKKGEVVTAVLTIQNASPYTITQLIVKPVATLIVQETTPSSFQIAPYTSTQAIYRVSGQTVGSQNLIFSVSYRWQDTATGIEAAWVETAVVPNIEIKPRFSFAWPDFLIPLILGFIVSQAGVYWNERRKANQEALDQETQVQHLLLATLQTAQQGIHAQEAISFNLWEEVIIKGHLSAALNRLSRKRKQPDLPPALAKLAIMFMDYNSRQQSGNLTDDLMSEYNTQINNLIQKLEKQS